MIFPLRQNNFRYPKPSETQRRFSTKWFGTVRQNIFDGNTRCSRTDLYLVFFATRNSQKHRRVPPRNSFALWYKCFWQKLVILPPSFLLPIKLFDTRNLVKHRRVPLRRFSIQWDSIYSIEKRDIPLLGIKLFDNLDFLKHRRVSLRNDLVLWDRTILTENYDARALSYNQTFSRPGIIRNTEGFLYEFLWHCETNVFDRKAWYCIPPFSYP